MNLRDKILSSTERRYELVAVPEWGCDVRVVEMSTGDRNYLMRVIAQCDGVLPEDYFARIVYMCACDSDGMRIFTEKDIPEIQDLSAAATKRIVDVATELNKLNNDPEAEAEKNSEATPDGSGDTE